MEKIQPKMAAVIRVHIFPPTPTLVAQATKLQIHLPRSMKARIRCSTTTNNNKINDLELALDLAAEVERINTRNIQAKEAMKRSRELLYGELCEYLGLGSEEVKKKWEQMDEDDKWAIIKEFAKSDWAHLFHPLSPKSVKELVDQHLMDSAVSDSSPTILFRGFKKFMGLPFNR